ncbi:patatin-like phospholipase family protein [Paenibacillus sp. D2_2]|uniref:patatin-like phospholipase family protein n=1 Tax=Paenibacillus sp. D2_2 TaxID=3073092 RepID=UPI002814ED9C|nr:patatin-like phospholipase family protein [Paenibacillus sp. D2_2]WMT39373.1 patatin-like phospholipase family protein [Paenibacillus sp. D2_2]
MKTALVLGGGAVRGLAHIGVLKAFERNGIKVDRIVGTSMGGAIGGLYAAGVPAEAIQEVILNTPKYRLIDMGIRHRGLLGGNAVQQTINGLLEKHSKQGLLIEQFPIEFKAIAVDLMCGQQVVLDHGDLGTALRATTAFPGVFAPLMDGDKMLVDGGVLNNLPVEEALDGGDDFIIAVDVAREHEKKPPRNMMEVVYRSYGLMAAGRRHVSLKRADYVIRPEVGYYASFDFTKSAECIKAGEVAAEQCLEELQQCIKSEQSRVC